MLCDHAQVVAEKLFISGANIDQIVVPPGIPAPYVVSLAIGGMVHVPLDATGVDHTLSFRFVTEDGLIPALPQGVDVGEGIGGEFGFQVTANPAADPRDGQMVPFAFTLTGVPLMKAGRYVVALSIDGSVVRRLPVTVVAEAAADFGPASIPRF